jgi:hypothetical protein
VIATNESRGSGAGEPTEYHNLVAWDREICGQFMCKIRVSIVRRERWIGAYRHSGIHERKPRSFQSSSGDGSYVMGGGGAIMPRQLSEISIPSALRMAKP